MKTVTNNYKSKIKEAGKEISVILTYDDNGTIVTLDNEDINSIDLHYDGNILKSVMKQLDIDCKEDIPVNSILTYQFGLKINNSYEYITMGDFVVNKVEKQADTNSYKITCYDKLLYSMIEYNNTGITYPITVRDYINAICGKIGLTFANASGTFINYNQNITEEPYLDEDGNSLGYTFRDVLDEMAKITGSTICINNSGQLELRYITNSGVTIDEDTLKNINVNFGEEYTVDLDIDAQVLNYMTKQTVLTNVYNQINGIKYYLNDFDTIGITYLELCDRYNIQVGNDTYSCVMLNDDINVTSGLKESIYTEKPKDAEQLYTYVNDTDKAVRKAEITLNQKIGEVDIRGKTINLTADNIAISSTNFSIDKNGIINAQGGYIGGWEIRKQENQNNKVYLGNNWGYGTTGLYFLSYDGLTAYYDTVGSKDWFMYFKSKFGVTTNGEVYARNANISGTITSSTIVGGTIQSTNYNYANNTGMEIDLSNGVITSFSSIFFRDGSSFYTSISGRTIETSRITVYNELDGDVGTEIKNNYVKTWSYQNFSLEKYKTNFEKLDNGLDIINSIDIYKYNLTSEKDNAKKHIGLVIGDNYKYSREITNNENNSVDLYSFAAVCCKAIQELNKKVERLENINGKTI